MNKILVRGACCCLKLCLALAALTVFVLVNVEHFKDFYLPYEEKQEVLSRMCSKSLTMNAACRCE